MQNDVIKDIEATLKKGKPVSDNEYRLMTHTAVVNLRAPLTGMMGYLAMLSKDDFGKLNPEHKKIIGDLLIENERVIIVINDLLELGRLERETETPYINTTKTKQLSTMQQWLDKQRIETKKDSWRVRIENFTIGIIFLMSIGILAQAKNTHDPSLTLIGLFIGSYTFLKLLEIGKN